MDLGQLRKALRGIEHLEDDTILGVLTENEGVFSIVTVETVNYHNRTAVWLNVEED